MDSTFYILGPYALVSSVERKICRIYKQDLNSKKVIASICHLLGIDNPSTEISTTCDELVSTYGLNSFLELGNFFICSSASYPSQTYSLCPNPRKILEQLSTKLKYPNTLDSDNYTLCLGIIDYCNNNPQAIDTLLQETDYFHEIKLKAENAISSSISLAKEAVPHIILAGKEIHNQYEGLIKTLRDTWASSKKTTATKKDESNDLYSRAIALVQKEYPRLYEHVALTPGGFSEHISLAYDSKTVILYQQGYVMTFPCDPDLSKTLDKVISDRKGIIDVIGFKEVLRSKNIRPSIEEYDVNYVDIELDSGEILIEQPDKVIKQDCFVSDCKVCKGKGYLPCPDKECRGRHEYTCPSCKGDGKVKCSTCNTKGEVKCPTCNGVGQYTCKQCKGEGEFQCSECKGKGHVKCSSCKGKGRVKCRRCNGLGKMANGDKCTSCYGDGYIRCQECHGAGEYKCISCNGKGRKKCNVCHGQRIVICNTCNGDKKVECKTCYGRGELTCRRCGGEGIVTCSTCIGDKEHYGMIECKTCNTLGMIGHLCYVHSDITTKKTKEIPYLNCNNHLEYFTEFVNFPELMPIYKNVNSKKTMTKDEDYISISNKVNHSLGVDFKSQNPRILKQSLTYQTFVSVFISCKHIVSNTEFNICILDIDGPKPLIIFPDYDNVTFKKSGFFKRIELANAKFFNTERHRNRIDKFNSVKVYLTMSKIDGEIGFESRPLLLRLINGVEELSSEEKEVLYKMLNSDTIDTTIPNDIEFTTQNVAKEVYENLKAICEADGQISSSEKAFLKDFHSKFLN